MIIVTQNNITPNEIIIDEFIENIKLSDSLEDIIENRYTSIGTHLNRNDSTIKKYNPTIYPQGSVRTGTAIKPLGCGAYDVDLVCELQIDHQLVSPFALKEMVGEEIKLYMSNKPFKSSIKESRKCWTIEYADKTSFHVDILPSIKKFEDLQNTSIYITNDTINGPPGNWEDSNPKGFAFWLKEKEFQIFSTLEKKLKLSKRLESIPEHKVLTPLRKSIMLLKRHRDVFFQGNDTYKPASVIITTLSGIFYENHPLLNTEQTLQSIIRQLELYIEENKFITTHTLVSPSSNENFLDKWNLDKNYKKFFELWCQKLIEDITDIKYFLNSCKDIDSDSISNEELNNFLLNQKHTIYDFPLELNPNITLSINKAENLYYSPSINASKFIDHKELVDKKIELKFIATTNVNREANFKVYWRVINTGRDAFSSKCLRGNMFYDSNYPKKFTRIEPTGYSGIHSIEAFIVKDKKIIAQSLPFIIKIK